MGNSRIRTLGYALFVGGMMFAVLFAAKPLDQEIHEAVDPSSVTTATYPDTWPLCVLGLICGGIGAGLIRRGRAEFAQSDEQSTSRDSGDSDDTVGQLRTVAMKLDAIAAETCEWTGPELRDSIDQLLIDQIGPITARQQQFSDRFGMARGAEIAVTVAVGERMLNRVWSTSADGYAEEASASLNEARQAFEQAAALASETT